MGILSAVACVVVMTGGTAENLTARASLVREDRPWAVTPAMHFTTGTLIGTAGATAVGLGIVGFGSVLFSPYHQRYGFDKTWGETTMAVSGILLGTGTVLVALASYFFRRATTTMRARAQANEVLDAMGVPR